MTPPEPPARNAHTRISVPRWLALFWILFVWLIVIPLVHGVIPWIISTLTTRYGWTAGQPGIWNLLGLLPVIIGAACLFWIMALHIAKVGEKVNLEWTPKYLLLNGPYAFARNPMYVAELLLWLGWAIFFGSIGVIIGFTVLCVLVNFVILPREERSLEARFGAAYLQYKKTVPRWLGKTRHP